MQPQGWKSFLFAIFFTTNGVVQLGTKLDTAWAENTHVESPTVGEPPQQVALGESPKKAERQCQQQGQEVTNVLGSDSELRKLAQTNRIYSSIKLEPNISPPEQIDMAEFSQGESCFQPEDIESEKFSESNQSLQSATASNCPVDICQQSIGLKSLLSQRVSDGTPAPASPNPNNPQPNNPQPDNPQPDTPNDDNTGDLQKQSDPPPLESLPGNNVPIPSPGQIEQLLDTPQSDYNQRLQNLIQVLQQQTQSLPDLGNLELGLRVKPRQIPTPPPLEQQPPIPQEKPVVRFKPIGSLQARLGYFYSSNIFSASVDPIQDSLIFYGLTLASSYLPLNPKTFISGSIDANQIHYFDQSVYDYNQLRFNVSLYRQLSRRMYGELSWSNQYLFYANNGNNFKAGDRFLNENTVRLSLGRRDPLSSKLFVDSFYELSFNFSDPDNRSRIVNSLWLSLSYYLQQPLQVGVNYQFNFSDFTNRPDAREDQFHRLFGHLNYRVSKDSSLNLQGGVSFGDSTSQNINFDAWFFSLNYRLQLGQF
ncbi:MULTISPECIES: hypothetical protein [Calothrix]|uniref:Uncharacterized protein n=2 Tax=Calothrix TaxID=1186 RepID=A0ABR8A6M1_9CYAN|nr:MULTISPECIES: hypothetical protein [Calothrix]MBD2195636.1 hypothetical protein [Calothrix parietina FACHB-288]MBD2224039.1 hypothetical protein [Calothrix anomala FACHB-343]